MKTTVVNLRETPSCDIRIDRPSKWGNPYRIGRDGDRDTVIALYADYLATRPDLLAAIPGLRGKVLGCHCKPFKCHGDILAKLANEGADQ